MARALHRRSDDMEAAVRLAVAILALVSAVATYFGVRGVFGSSPVAILAALAYAGGVSTGIYVFWSCLIRYLPRAESRHQRGALLIILIAGTALTLALSSWFNAAALAGPAALQRHLADLLTENAAELDFAYRAALAQPPAAGSALPVLAQDGQKPEFTRISGAFDAAAVASASALSINQALVTGSNRLDTLYRTGTDHVTRMRRLLPATTTNAAAIAEFFRESTGLAEIIDAISAHSNPSGRHLLTAGSPAESREAQSDFPLARLVLPSRPEIVLRHAGAFVPSWIAAIAIDVLPTLLVLTLFVARLGSAEAVPKSPPTGDDRSTPDAKLPTPVHMAGPRTMLKGRVRQRGLSDPHAKQGDLSQTGMENRPRRVERITRFRPDAARGEPAPSPSATGPSRRTAADKPQESMQP